MELTGTYHNLGLFFDRVSRLSRLVNVRNLKVKATAKANASNTIDAACLALTYVYKDAPPPPAKGGGRRRSRGDGMKRALRLLALLPSAPARSWRRPRPAAPPAGRAKSILDQELEPAPGGYTYNPQGRRDPFVSLVRPVGPQGGKVRPRACPAS